MEKSWHRGFIISRERDLSQFTKLDKILLDHLVQTDIITENQKSWLANDRLGTDYDRASKLYELLSSRLNGEKYEKMMEALKLTNHRVARHILMEGLRQYDEQAWRGLQLQVEQELRGVFQHIVESSMNMQVACKNLEILEQFGSLEALAADPEIQKLFAQEVFNHIFKRKPAEILMEGSHDQITNNEMQGEIKVKKPEQVSTSEQNPSEPIPQVPLEERLSACRQKLQNMFPAVILDHIFNKKPLNIREMFERVLSLRKDGGTQDTRYHYLPEDDRGLSCILNTAQFDKNSDQRDDSLFDVEHLKTTFTVLNYEIFPPIEAKLKGRRKTKVDMLRLIDQFVRKCEDQTPASIVVFIGSHGRHPREIETSCGEYIPLMEKIVERFYANKSPKLKGIPKLFIVQACQGTALRKDENLTEDSNDYNILMLEATSPGGAAYSDPSFGSFLVNCFIAAVSQHGRDKPIQEVLQLAKEKLVMLRNEGIIPLDQDPTITDRTLKNIYLNI